MPAVIFSGSDVKTLKDNIDLNGQAKVKTGTADPTSVAQDGLKGSVYLRTGASGGAAYIKTDNGSSTNWSLFATGSSATQYDRIVADPAIAGFSTDLTLTAAIAAASAGDEILVMNNTFTENVTITKQLKITGQGRGSVISGNLTFNSSADHSCVEHLKVTGNITFDSGADKCVLAPIYVTSSMVYTDNTTSVEASPYVHFIEE
jgi:hypothetical protein